VLPLGTNRSLTLVFSTRCTDEDVQPMTTTEVAYWWQAPPAYVTIVGEELTEPHAKEPLDCADAGHRIESTLGIEVSVNASAPGLTPFEVLVFGMMNKTNALGETTYGPATANVSLATGYRAGLDLVEIPADRSVKPGNETTIRLRVYNLANAPVRVVFDVEPVAVNGTALTVLETPSPVELASVLDGNGSSADVAIAVRAPGNVTGPGYEEYAVRVTATGTPAGPTPFNETTVLERTFTRRVGGMAPDAYSPMPGPAASAVGALLVALWMGLRRPSPERRRKPL
jgi:hypothetical protein